MRHYQLLAIMITNKQSLGVWAMTTIDNGGQEREQWPSQELSFNRLTRLGDGAWWNKKLITTGLRPCWKLRQVRKCPSLDQFSLEEYYILEMSKFWKWSAVKIMEKSLFQTKIMENPAENHGKSSWMKQPILGAAATGRAPGWTLRMRRGGFGLRGLDVSGLAY